MMTEEERGPEGEGGRVDRPDTMEDPEWVVAKSLLEVNDMCTSTLEQFMLYATSDRFDEVPEDHLGAQLDELIEKHTQAVVELELAKEALVDANAD